MSDSPSLDPTQQSAIDRAYNLLGEHFDHVLIVVSTEDANSNGDIIKVCHKGGFAAAIGLAELGKAQIMQGFLDSEDC